MPDYKASEFNSSHNIKWDINSEASRRIGRYMYCRELLPDLESDTLFRAMVYSIVAINQDLSRTLKIYDMLLDESFDTPKNIQDGWGSGNLENILKINKWPNSKMDYIAQLAEEWDSYNMPDLIENTLHSSRREELQLRKKLVKTIRGAKEKTASLFMLKCGFDWVVPVDRWTIRYAEDELGCKPEWSSLSIRGLRSYKEYLSFEEPLVEKALAEGYTPPQFQTLIWSQSPHVREVASNLMGLKKTD